MRRVGIVLSLLAAATMASAEPAKQAEPKAKAREQAKEQPKEVKKEQAKDKPPAKDKSGAEKTEVSKALLDSYNAIPLAERIAIQSDLIWTGDYNGVVSGEFGDRSIAAVKAFQKRSGAKETGVLIRRSAQRSRRRRSRSRMRSAGASSTISRPAHASAYRPS